MIDLIKKSMLVGVGFALKTKDEMQDLAKDIIKKSKMSERDGKKFIRDLEKRYDAEKKDMEDRVEKTVKELLKKGGIVTRDEIKELKNEIRELKKALGKDSTEASGKTG